MATSVKYEIYYGEELMFNDEITTFEETTILKRIISNLSIVNALKTKNVFNNYNGDDYYSIKFIYVNSEFSVNEFNIKFNLI